MAKSGSTIMSSHDVSGAKNKVKSHICKMIIIIMNTLKRGKGPSHEMQVPTSVTR